MSTTTFLCGEI